MFLRVKEKLLVVLKNNVFKTSSKSKYLKSPEMKFSGFIRVKKGCVLKKQKVVF